MKLPSVLEDLEVYSKGKLYAVCFKTIHWILWSPEHFQDNLRHLGFRDFWNIGLTME